MLGTRLGRWAIYHDIPVAKIAKAIGATRQSVYNWMKGGQVFVAYEPAVVRIIYCMETARSSEEAWGNICQDFNSTT